MNAKVLLAALMAIALLSGLTGCGGCSSVEEEPQIHAGVAINDPLHIAVVLRAQPPIPFSGIQQIEVESLYVDKEGSTQRALLHAAASLWLCPCDRVETETFHYLDLSDTEGAYIEQGTRVVWRDSRYKAIEKTQDEKCARQAVSSWRECPEARSGW